MKLNLYKNHEHMSDFKRLIKLSFFLYSKKVIKTIMKLLKIKQL